MDWFRFRNRETSFSEIFQVRSDRLKKIDIKFVQGNSAFLLDTLLAMVNWIV